MPGFTHLQSAQPVTFGHHLMAYVEMFARDREPHPRFPRAPQRMPARRRRARRNLVPDRPRGGRAQRSASTGRPATPSIRSPTATSLLEFLAAASICAMHLSRLAEEIVIWMSAPFGFVRLPDRWTTGSSIMPQKRNPDAAELVRGKAGRIFGALMALLTMMKGLPLAYSKDMQEDKEQLFDAADTLEIVARRHDRHGRGPRAGAGAMAAAAGAGFSTATDLADWLVRQPRHAVPRRPPRHRAARRGGGAARLRPRGPAARAPSRRSSRASRGRGLRGARRREFGPFAHELRRHGAGAGRRAGGLVDDRLDEERGDKS